MLDPRVHGLGARLTLKIAQQGGGRAFSMEAGVFERLILESKRVVGQKRTPCWCVSLLPGPKQVSPLPMFSEIRIPPRYLQASDLAISQSNILATAERTSSRIRVLFHMPPVNDLYV